MNTLIKNLLSVLDFFSPIVTEVPCGCGDWYPAPDCKSCNGTGMSPTCHKRTISTEALR